MFEPIIKYAMIHGRYYATETELVADLQRAGFQISPQMKDPHRPRKTWLGSPGQHLDNGTPKPGVLIVAEGKSVMVEDEAGKGEQFTWSTPIVPYGLARYITPQQHDFFVEYRHHEDYQRGIPVLAPAYASNDAEWWAYINYGAGSVSDPLAVANRWLPPVGVPAGWAWRWKPGSTGMRMEDVEVFPMEQYRRQFKPPVAQPKPAGEYKYTDAELGQGAMNVLFGSGDVASKGRAIRALAEERK